MKLADITPAPWNARKITEESVAELARSIEEQGLISPITLWRDGYGRWLCIAGNRRLAAIRSLHSKGWDGELPKDHYTVYGGDENDARAVTITENLQREDIGLLDEAAAVTTLLDLGMKVETVAARLGKSATWVRRRSKLAALDEAWKARANEIDADALEHIAAYPADIQQRVAKMAGQWATKWMQIASYFGNEMRDLTSVKFDCGECAKCVKRTGAAADLFGEPEGGLGKCLDAKCFEKRRKAWEDAEIARLVGDAEVVMKKWAYEYDYAKGKKRSKANPCAYVWVNGDEIEVTWGESLKERKRREEAERKAREDAEREERDERRRVEAIVGKLDDWKNGGKDGGYPDGLVGIVTKHRDSEFVIGAAADSVVGWHSNGEWAKIIQQLPEIAELAGVSADEAEYLVGKCADEDEE